jgi:hypothetical protein
VFHTKSTSLPVPNNVHVQLVVSSQTVPDKLWLVSLMQYDVLRFGYKLRKETLLKRFEVDMESGLNWLRIH